MTYAKDDLVRLGSRGYRHVNPCSGGAAQFFLWDHHDEECVMCLTDELFIVDYNGGGFFEVRPVNKLIGIDGEPIDLIDVDSAEITRVSPLELLALEGI